ncbi:MAG: DUF4292 domain-containing protein [Muribaculaceae bacterium]|nr:DUF4292 domain-containing protein [Muribaculaceae bacterium]
MKQSANKGFSNIFQSPERSVIFHLFLVVVLLLSVVPAYSQTALTGKKAEQAVGAITKDYTNWRTAGWSAKVKAEMLPVSVTMKTYMLRDSLTLISLRAPLFGEVARIEIDNCNIKVINKFKKCYHCINLSAYGSVSAEVHSNLQDILTGRVTLIDSGILSKSNYKEAGIYSFGDGNYLITCQLPEEYGSIDYGYAVDKSSRIIEMMAVKGKPRATSAPDGMQSGLEEISAEASAQVNYSGNVADATVSVNIHRHSMTVELTGISLETGISGFARLDLRGYRETGLSEVMKF